MYIDNVYLTPSNVNFTKDYAKNIQKVSLATNLAGLTLNPGNYHFGCHKIKFWGMIYSSKGMKPDQQRKSCKFLVYVTLCDAIIFLRKLHHKENHKLNHSLCRNQNTKNSLSNHCKTLEKILFSDVWIWRNNIWTGWHPSTTC